MNQSPSPQTDAGLGRTILIADDDPRLRALLIWTLEMGQYRVLAAVDGLDALQQAREHQVIAPILILTGFGSEEDKVAGLEAGADDYQTKPFGTKELLARVNALLRRSNVYAGDTTGDAFVTGDLRVDFDQHLAYKAGRPLELTPTEFNILAFLARSPGEVQASRAILQKVWGPAYRDEVHLLRVNVARLRRKIEDVASDPQFVLTHSRVGYSLATHPAST